MSNIRRHFCLLCIGIWNFSKPSLGQRPPRTYHAGFRYSRCLWKWICSVQNPSPSTHCEHQQQHPTPAPCTTAMCNPAGIQSAGRSSCKSPNSFPIWEQHTVQSKGTAKEHVPYKCNIHVTQRHLFRAPEWQHHFRISLATLFLKPKPR